MMGCTWLVLATLMAAEDIEAQAARQEAAKLIVELGGFPDEGLWGHHDEKAQDPQSVAARELMERLAKLGQPAVPELIAALDSPNRTLQGRAALVLAQIGPAATAAIPLLIEQLKHQGGYMPELMAKRALRRFGPLAEPALLKAVEHNDERIRWQATWVLGEIRPASPKALAALIKLLTDDSDSVKVTAAGMLENIGEPAVAPLIEAMQSDTEHKLFNPSGILMHMGPAARQAVPILRTRLTAPYPVVEHATFALLAIEVERTSTEARSPDIDTRLRASWVLGKGYWRNGCTPAEGAAAIEGLVAALRDEDERVRENAARGLAHTGPWARHSLPALSARVDDPAESPDVRYCAIVSLGTLRAAGRDALPLLRRASVSPEQGLRAPALRAIERIENPTAELGCDE